MLRVTSEVGRLRRVIVQPPGVAHERVLPRHIHPGSDDYILFDDLVHVPGAREEHAELQAVLGAVAEVHIFEELAAEALASEGARKELLDGLADRNHVSDERLRQLEQLDPARLASSIIVGTVGGGLDDPELFHPLPNLIFTRDLAAIVGSLVVVASASKKARRRESLLTWAIVDHHEIFKGAAVAELSRRVWSQQLSASLTIEGGDVLVLSSSLACIGASERTTWSTIAELSEELLSSGLSRVLVVEMPKQRSSMHLDTVFTQVDWGAAVVYPPLLQERDPEFAVITRLRRQGGVAIIERHDCDLFEALDREGYPMQTLRCGGGHPIHSRREQWTDGANYVALGPGVVVGYARNVYTSAEMAEHGFEVVDTRGFLDSFERDHKGDADDLFASGRRIVINIEGSELCRGRGGPRCLTLPIERD